MAGPDLRWPVDAVDHGSLTRLIARVPRAGELDATSLAAFVCEAYVAIGVVLAQLGRHPIRFWNFVPGIGDRMTRGLDRYMVFNQGRYEAFARAPRLTGPAWSLATSSAVGIAGQDLVIDCLASVAPGIPVENPRQISSWRYSPCYGPKPPCFARATIARVGGRRCLLIGGTASIVGDDSRHSNKSDAQLSETLANLTAVIAAASGRSHDALDRLTDVRVYIAHPEHATQIADPVRAHCRGATRIEFAIAAVCRPELLVEIEGVARLT